ncbi:putative DnaJ domain, tetratricopeptide-like helical domain superfamily [Helianthus anomalus]
MTSSNSNSSNRLLDFNETNPVLGFNTTPFSASASGSGSSSSGSHVSRARFMKGRKQTVSHNHKSGNQVFRSSTQSVFGDVGYGNAAKDMFLFGGNEGGNYSSYCGLDEGDSNVVVDDMSRLNIDSEKGDSTFGLQAFGLKGSDVEGASDVKSTNQFTSSVDGNVVLEMQSEMKKMDVKDPADVSSEGGFRGYERTGEFAFTSRLDDVRVTNVEFKTPDMRKNMFSGLNRFDARKEHGKETRSKKKKGKLKRPVVDRSRIIEDFVFGGRNLSGSSDGFDIPTYDEMLAGSYSRETSVTSEASQVDEQDNVSNESRVITSNVTTDDEAFEPQVNEVSETESFVSATENLEYSCDTMVTSLDSDVSSTATSGRQESGGTRVFSFGSRSEDVSNGNFTFAASSSGQSQLPSDTRQHIKKPPLKITRDSYISTKPEFFPVDLSASSSIKKDNLKLVNEQDFRHESLTSSSLSSSKAAEEACEKWRLRGNQAYSNGDLAKAEDCYTQGLNSVSENEKSTSCLRALMLCYSNRAAARMSTGRMKEALEDCLMAAAIDPNFLKVQVRAAHCYLAMGEIENAKQQYMKCLQFRNDNSADGKVIAEASEGLEKVQKVLNCIDQCTDLLQRRASEDLESALRLINDALHISTCSDKLLQIKADSLFMLRRYEEVIQILTSDKADTSANSSSRTWRSHLIIKSYFYLGRLDEALEFFNKQDSAIPLADTIHELLSHKMAGNEAYRSGKHSEAVEHYTAALSCSVESRPFVSVCFCNRAAVYRALGQITDGIADCSLAIALDPNYLKAISRRASLYEMIRDYGQAAKDLQRLVSLLTTQVEKGAVSGASDNLSCMNELKQTQIQLSNVEMESRKGIPLNAYLILGVESTASAADIKKAYRKAALKHHPDKAAQLLGRGDDGDDGLWKKIAENVHKDADRLFKMIGEAYAVLSNPSKRSKYDQDEAKRNEVNRFTRSNSSRTAADVQNSVFEQSGNVRQWQDSAGTYTRTQSTGSENIGSSYTYSKYY